MAENDSQENKKPRRIDPVTRYKLIGTAIIFDLISIIPVVGQFLAIGGAGITFYIWFKMLGVSFISPKKIVTTVVEYIGEAIPVVSALPLITTGTIIMIVLTDIEDKTGVGVAGLATGKIPKGQLKKDISRTANKTVRREANPERVARARERLVRMKEQQANGGSATSAGRQTMKDVTARESVRQNNLSPQRAQNPQRSAQAQDRPPLVQRQGVNQEIAAPNQILANDNGPLNDYSPSSSGVENEEKIAA